MSFWIRRTPAGSYLINDLGLEVLGSGAEMDLHLAYSYEVLQDSANLAAALLADEVTRITGSGGSVIPAASAFADSVAPHALDATAAHTGLLDIAQLKRPVKTLTVASQGADYTSIKAAVDAAISGGASASAPWSIIVYPGTYAEDPMTIQAGISLSSQLPNRMDTVFVTPTNPAADLFTCTGGYIAGIRASGVTDAAKALFRCATASTLTVMHGVSMRGCSQGLVVSGGASVILTNFSINLTGPSQGLTTGISISGTNSYLAVVNGFFSVPAALLPAYGSNPIQTLIKASGACSTFLVGCAFHVAYKDTTADVVLAENGAFVSCVSGEATGCANVIHIGSAGSDTKIVVQGLVFTDNVQNVWIESSSGVVFANFSADARHYTGVSGAKQSGMVQYRNDDTSKLFGEIKYVFPTEKEIDFEDYFADFNTTGVCGGGEVTAGTGLHVDVSAGDGWIRRSATDEDAFWVEWAAQIALDLTASTTNYVIYDSVTEAILADVSAPGEEGILLATVVTDGSGIRFLHNTRNVIDGPWDRLYRYLLDTRKLALKNGLAVTNGTEAKKISVGSGSYYLALDVNSYAGSVDSTFSYFYGTNGATEVTGQTMIDISQYDNAGTLAGLTSGYFKSDTVFLTSDGRISVIYGTAEYATQPLALAAATGNAPTFVEPSSFPLARLIIEEGNDVVEIVDIRPQPAQGTGGGAGGVSVHAALAGLGSDDHSQYLLTDGNRALTGGLNLNTHAITNVTTVNGVTVEGHASRHNPGGSDALATDTPTGVQVGATPAAGSASSYAKSDHQHGIATGTPVAVGTANAPGSSSSTAHLDHVHAGLTRGAADFGSFTAKGTPTISDVLLIEDAADSSNKKKITIGTLPATAPAVHASSHRFTASDPIEGRQLFFWLDEGPGEGFASGAYKEVTGGVFPSSVIWYDSSGVGKKKIVEKVIVRNPNQIPTKIYWYLYDDTETLIRTILDTITYSGVFETSRTRTVV